MSAGGKNASPRSGSRGAASTRLLYAYVSRCTLLFVYNSEVTTSMRLVGCNVIASSCDPERQCSSGMHMR